MKTRAIIFSVLAFYAISVVAQNQNTTSTTSTTNTNTTNITNLTVKSYSTKNLNPKIITFINKKDKTVRLVKHPTLLNTDIPVTEIVPGGSVSFKVGTVDSVLLNYASGLKYVKRIAFALKLGDGVPIPFELANMDRTIYIVGSDYEGQGFGGVIAKKNKPITYCVLSDAASNTLEEIMDNKAIYNMKNSSSYDFMFMDPDFAFSGLTLVKGKSFGLTSTDVAKVTASGKKLGKTGIFTLHVAIISKTGEPTEVQEIDLPIGTGSEIIEITDDYFSLSIAANKFVTCCLKNGSPYTVTIASGAYKRKKVKEVIVINPGKSATFLTPYGENTLKINFTDDRGIRQKGYAQFGNNGRGMKSLWFDSDIESKFYVQ